MRRRIRSWVASLASSAHSAVHSGFDARATAALTSHALRRGQPPAWFTANGITTVRTALIAPTIVSLSTGWCAPALPVAAITVNALGDFFDGVVARWERTDPDRRAYLKMSLEKGASTSAEMEARLTVPSKLRRRLDETWGSYYDAMADKVFFLPIWITMFATTPATGIDSVALQSALISLTSIEAAACYVRTRSYFLQDSGIPAEAVGKVKYFAQAIGTALVLVPSSTAAAAGTCLLVSSVPLAAVSVLRKMQGHTIYVELARDASITPERLDALAAARSKGSRLVVGIPEAACCDDVAATLQHIACIDSVLRLPNGEDGRPENVASFHGWKLDGP